MAPAALVPFLHHSRGLGTSQEPAEWGSGGPSTPFPSQPTQLMLSCLVQRRQAPTRQVLWAGAVDGRTDGQEWALPLMTLALRPEPGLKHLA